MKNLAVLISGKQGSGKSTLSSELFKALEAEHWVYALKFATPLYEMHSAIFKVLEKYGHKYPEKPDGTLLQMLGTEWGRKCLGENFWAGLLRNSVKTHLNMPKLWPKPRIFLIDDARFPNELACLEGIEGLSLLKIRLEAPEHVRRARAEKWRAYTEHPSEIALDQYTGFNGIIFTDTHNAEGVRDCALRMIREALK